MIALQKHIHFVCGLAFLSAFIWALPPQEDEKDAAGNWSVKVFQGSDILFYWQAQSNRTYEEAKAVCESKNMRYTFHLDLILPELSDLGEYWATYPDLPAVVHVNGAERKIFLDYKELSQRKGLVCSAALKAAVVMFANGSSNYITHDIAQIPAYCYPQHADRNDHDLLRRAQTVLAGLPTDKDPFKAIMLAVARNSIFGLAFISAFIWAQPQEGKWSVKFFDKTDILYYWESQSNYTYEEAREVCQSRKMLSRVHIERILPGMTGNMDYWAPHAFQSAWVVQVAGRNRKILDTYSQLAQHKGVLCSGALKGAMVLFSNGLSQYVGQDEAPIPSYCHPQNANRNTNGSVAACMLLIRKYELEA